MRIAHYLTQRAGGFSLRLVVPCDLRSVFSVSVIKRTLRTRHRLTAQVWALALAERYAWAFAVARGQPVPKNPPGLDDILQSFRQGRARDYTLKVGDIEIEANSPEDHSRAMEALAKIGEIGARPINAPRRKCFTLAKALETYAEVEGSNLRENTWDARRRAFDSFSEKVGASISVEGISRTIASDWGSGLIRQGVSKRTAVNYVSHVAQLFEFLIRQGHITVNPVKGVLVMKEKDKSHRKNEGYCWEPFELDQLKAIYSPENFTRIKTDHVRWASLLGLFTGARVGEIAQIFLRDFVEQDGLLCVRLTSESDGQRLKNDASRRIVPLHPGLLKLGLRERIDVQRKLGQDKLFPNVRLDGKAGVGNAISKGFSYYLKAISATPRRQNGRVGFHSLRKTVIQELQASGLSDERRRAFVGHEQANDVHSASYMRPWTAEELASLFPGLRWSEWLDLDRLKLILSPKG